MKPTATALAARLGPTDWDLTGVTTGNGQRCDHCPRTIKHLYTVTNRRTGETLTVGRGCCKKVTGWTLAMAEAQALMRAAAIEIREQIAYDVYGDTYRLAVALAQFDHPHTHQASALWVELRDGNSDHYRDHLIGKMPALVETLRLTDWGLEDIEAEAAYRRNARLAKIAEQTRTP